MKKNPLVPIAVLAFTGLSASAFAQSGTVTNAPAPEAASSPAPTPNQIVYRATLPSAQEVTNAAAQQGLTVEQINQSSGEVIAVYKTKSGQTMTVAYALLPTAGAPSAYSQTVAAAEYAPTGTVVNVPSETVVTAQPAATTVIYTDPYYYDTAYSPWYYGYGWSYPGIALGIGFGGYYSHGYHGGYYHGGYYHGGYYHGGYNHGGYPHGGHPGSGEHGGEHAGAGHAGPTRSAGTFHTGGGYHH